MRSQNGLRGVLVILMLCMLCGQSILHPANARAETPISQTPRMDPAMTRVRRNIVLSSLCSAMANGFGHLLP